MNKIKRQTVEELLQAEELYNEERKRDNTSEEFKNVSSILWNLHVTLEVETDRSEEEKKRLEWFVIGIVKEFARAKMSISRLLKCLEVCGIEVV
jgi:hypothetical protein